MYARLTLAAFALGACATSTIPDSPDVGAATDAVADGPAFPPRGTNVVDLLLMIDNSGSQRDNQTLLLEQIPALIDGLVNPPCVSSTNATPHACDPSNAADTPQHAPVVDLHLGVVSSDLGTPGSIVPGCTNGSVGDHGMLNPIRYGGALAMHEPWVSAPAAYGRPLDCTNAVEYPAFIAFASRSTNPATFAHDGECNAGIYVDGCGLASQLEAAYRALTYHNSGDPGISPGLRSWPGGDSANAGFLRPDALLAILVLSGFDDGSVRNSNYAEPAQPPPDDATDVYNPLSMAWASAFTKLRFYMYRPGGPQDPTWTHDRYFDPSDLSRGFLGLKPGRPDRVVFAAITGVPLDGPTLGVGSGEHADWNALLGAAGPGGPDDFVGRDSSTAYTAMSPEGPVSMRQADADLACPTRVVPACQRRGTMYDPMSCAPDIQYFAWPARRIVELARRFDEDPVCDAGRPCHDGMVASVCESDFAAAVSQFLELLAPHLAAP